MNQIAFIGLGIMGLPMAGHLLRAGHSLIVNTRTKSRAQSLLDTGAHWAESPADAARGAAVVFLCVNDTPDVEKVLFGPRGVIESARPGLIVVDHSTISPEAEKRFASRLAEKGTTLLDAPVSGGDVGAKNAALSIMVGGEAKALETVRPLLQCMGKTITHCGPVGAGQSTKLVNQILVTLTNLATCEALAFASASGLDPQTTIAAVGGGAAASWQLLNLGPRMVKGDFDPGFMIDLQVKDLHLVAEAARQAQVNLPATALVHHYFTQAQRQGLGREGTQALFKIVQSTAQPSSVPPRENAAG